LTFGEFEKITRLEEPLASHTTFGIGGAAQVLVTPRTIDELCDVVAMWHGENLPLYVLGRGSNVLVSDSGVRGIVVSTRRLSRVDRDGTTVFAEAGAFLPRVVNLATVWGLTGFEPCVGIPGTVGGALAMNAGGRHGTVSNILRTVTIIESDGSLKTLEREDICFGHRDSALKGTVIAKATFDLEECRPGNVSNRCRVILGDKKKTQPMSTKNAGCIFKNPPGESAGKLIDAAQLKSLRVGGARISRKHANFIVNCGKASARDVLTLIATARREVAERFDVALRPEVQMWGFESPRNL